MDVTSDVALELVFDEYVHMLARVAPWLTEEAEDTLRPFCHWLYARTAFDVPLAAADEAAVRTYSAQQKLAAEAVARLEDGLRELRRFAGELRRAS